MSQEKTQFDVIVIGGGPGGLWGCAVRISCWFGSSSHRAKSRVGGTVFTCRLYPRKRTSRTASVLRTVRHAEEFGVQTGEPQLNLAKTMERKQAVIDQLTAGVEGLPQEPPSNYISWNG